MKKSILFLCAFLCFGILNAGNLKIYPEKIDNNTNILINYSHPTNSLIIDSVYVAIYSYTKYSSTPIAQQHKLNYNVASKNYSIEVKTPLNADLLIYKTILFTKSGQFEDNNYGRYELSIIYNDGKPIANSNLLAAIAFMGNSSFGPAIVADYNTALDYLKKEVNLYPDNLRAQIGITSLLFDLQKIYFEDYKSLMEELLEKPFNIDNENEVTARIRAYKSLNKSDDADELTQQFVARHQESKLAEEDILNKLKKAENLEKFSEISKTFIISYPNSQNREKVLNAVISAYMQNDKYKELIDLLDFVKPENKTEINFYLAQYLINSNKAMPSLTEQEKLDTALKIYRRALNWYYINMNKNSNFKPKYFCEYEYKQFSDNRLANYLINGAEIFMKLNETDSVIKYIENSIKLNEIASEGAYKILIEKLVSKNKLIEAEKYIKIATINSIFYDGIKSDYLKINKMLYNYSDSDGASNYDKLLTDARQKRFFQLATNQQKTNVNDLIFSDLNNNPVSNANQKGKIRIYAFWASWCAPCQAAIPALEEIADIYKNDNNIEFAAVNLWEKTKNNIEIIEEFIKNNEPEYNILFDENNSAISLLSLTGLPSTVVIDADGFLRFKINGFSSTDDYLMQINDIVDFLIEENKK